MTDFFHVPAITLTDPHNQHGIPSPSQSPVKDGGAFAEGLSARVVGGGRPSTPGKHNGRDSARDVAGPWIGFHAATLERGG